MWQVALIEEPQLKVLMAIEIVPLPLSPSSDAEHLKDFGREVIGVDITQLSQVDFQNIEKLLYKVQSNIWLMLRL